MKEQQKSTENRIRILLVEDNQADRQALERLSAKEQLPYQFEIATTCAEALERIRQSTYDMVLLDYNLNDGTGLDILPKLKDTPAIFITGSGDEETAALAMKQGACDYLIKDLERNYLRLLPHTIQSVLERKQAEQTIARLSRQHELILNSAGEGIYGLDQDGKMVFMNPAAERMLGYRTEELRELGPDRLHTLLHHIEPKTPHTRYDCYLFAPFNEETSRHATDDVFWRKDGSSFPVDYSSTPMKERGQITGAVIIFKDITERKQAEQAIARLNRRNELILNSAGEGIYGLDHNGKMIFMNPAAERKLGFSVDELASLSADQLHTLLHHGKPSASPHLRATCPIFATFRDGIAHKETDDVFWRKDGSPFPVDYSSTPIKEAGRVIGAVVVFRGIAERKRAEKALKEFSGKLQRSNEELQHFASVASHDLQEPLHKVIAFGDLLKRHCGSSLGEKGHDYIQRMDNASQRMKQLIEDLLRFSRVTSKAQPFELVSLGRVVHEISIDLEVRISETHGRIEVGHLPVIEADPLQMRQLLQNLAGNALKFHKEGVAPVIYLNSRQIDNGFWEITVEDNGIGFDENYLEKIFKPFERLHGRGQYIGSGMGLTICHKIVSRHGGTLTARSTEQKGATFIITLPEKQTKR